MYKIEKKHYGVKLVFDGFIQKQEMSDWVAESEKLMHSLPSTFNVFVDMRGLKTLPKDSQLEMQRGQNLFKANGMVRSVVILSSAMTTVQFMRIAKETGIYLHERYINAEKTSNWETIGEKWLVEALDPDL